MDPFKLLSRSSKLSRDSSTNKPSNPSSRPSSTAHDPAYLRLQSTTASSSSKKRKRRSGASSENGASIDQGLDFFGQTSNLTTSRPLEHSGKDPSSALQIGDYDTSDHESEQEAESLGAEECKAILRKRKIRIVQLWSLDSDSLEAKQDKKSKRRKSVQKEDTTSVKKQRKPEITTQPLISFKELRSRYKIYQKLVSNVAAQGYHEPTEVQLGSLPLLLDAQRRDAPSPPINLLSVAPTGSGKTLAFLIPTINAILQSRGAGEPVSGPQAVVLAPTKELAWQIVNEAKKLTLGTGIRVTLMKKGMRIETSAEDPSPDVELSDSESGFSSSSGDDDTNGNLPGESTQTRKLPPRSNESPPVKSPILVATPLTLLNALKSSVTSTDSPSLPNITFLTLDEADILLDPLFREQTLAVISACTNKRLQMTMWSATMGSNIESLAQSLLQTRGSPFPLLRLVVGIKDTAVSHVHHRLIYAATEHGKLTALRDLLHPSSSSRSSTKDDQQDHTPPLRPPFLIFTQTIPRAIALHSEIAYDIPAVAGGSSRLAVLHADLSATQRESIMRRFRNAEIWVLITTDVLARGIDFRGLNGVVNYDFPLSAAVYVHRVGRAGRMGRDGVAVTLYAKEDVPFVKAVVNVIRASQTHKGGSSLTESSGTAIPEYLLTLPAPSKRAKKELKKHGIASRRTGAVVKNSDKPSSHRDSSTTSNITKNYLGTEDDNREQKKPRKLTKTRISTKSGYDRRLENRRRGFVEKNRDVALKNGTGVGRDNNNDDDNDDDYDGGEFTGFD